MLEKYLSLGKVSLNDCGHLFRGSSKSAKGLWIPHIIKANCQLEELPKAKLAHLGYNPIEFGVCGQAANAGVPDIPLKCHGRWKYEAMKHRCI